MQATTQKKWTFLFKLPGGHSYFKDAAGGIGVKDDTGTNPDNSEGGPLWVDTTQPIPIGQYGSIRVKDRKGEGYSIIECAENALDLAVRLNMRVNVHGRNFMLSQVE